MADYAKSVLGFDGTVILEDQSRTTWENITNVIPLLEDVDRIKIVSQPAHALKARAYLRRQRLISRTDSYVPTTTAPANGHSPNPCSPCTDSGHSAVSQPTSGDPRRACTGPGRTAA